MLRWLSFAAGAMHPGHGAAEGYPVRPVVVLGRNAKNCPTPALPRFNREQRKLRDNEKERARGQVRYAHEARPTKV